jgi:hypothetical protein
VIREDHRSHRVAIVPDCLVNPGSVLYASLPGRPAPLFDVLVADGWGIMKPPPHVLGAAIGQPAVAIIAGDAVDYRRHGHEVVVLAVAGLPGGGVWLDELEAAFRELGEAMPRIVRLGLDDASPGAPRTPSALRAALAAAAEPSAATR